MNQYSGFHPSNGFEIPRESPTPAKFFEDYVSKRKPCILPSPLTLLVDLRSIKGKVQVERMENSQFGSGNRVEMEFEEFLKELPKGNLYLTTQYKESLTAPQPREESEKELDDDEESIGSNDTDFEANLLPEFAQPPLCSMLDKIPHRLEIASNLIGHQMNLWVGNSKTGVSSGLHHDFHDNLYCVLQGTKKFTIFSPKDAENLYLNGELKRVFSNGLMEYRGGPPVRADGAFIEDVSEWKIAKAEELIESAETESQAEAAEKSMDDALEFAASELYAEEAQNNDSENEDELEDDESAEEEEVNSRKRKGSDLTRESNIKKKKSSLPVSFSLVPPQYLRDNEIKNAKDFPLLKKAAPITFELKKGECLYLPCGWFHEVVSVGSKDNTHIALNYWFAPPTTNNINAPYDDDYWKETWADPIAAEIGKIMSERERTVSPKN